MNLIYHIVSETDWAKQADQPNARLPAGTRLNYEADSLRTEGFIHLSKMEQVAGVLDRYYQGTPNLLLVHVDADKLTSELKYEVSVNNDQFPHLYGPLNKDAVVWIEKIR